MTLVYTIPAVRDAWADTAIPTTDIVDPGNAFAAAGWLQSSVPPPRQYFNWALNWTANAVRYFMQNGIVDWQAGELYQQSAVVVFNNFVFQSLVNSNQGNTPPAAQGSTAFWAPLAGYATIANLASFVTAAQLSAALSIYATLANPTFTGIPQAPTAAGGTASNQLATTAFVQAALSSFATNSALAAAISGFGAGKLPNNIYRNALGSGVVTVQQGGTPSGGSPGDIWLIY